MAGPTIKYNRLNLSADRRDRDWQRLANCRDADPAIFFPEPIRGRLSEPRLRREVGEALAVCDGCPVRVACLLYARAFETTYGVWGGRYFGRVIGPAHGDDRAPTP